MSVVIPDGIVTCTVGPIKTLALASKSLNERIMGLLGTSIATIPDQADWWLDTEEFAALAVDVAMMSSAIAAIIPTIEQNAAACGLGTAPIAEGE